MKTQQRPAQLAFEALYDMALGYLENGYKLEAAERLAEKAKLRELRRIAEWEESREREAGE